MYFGLLRRYASTVTVRDFSFQICFLLFAILYIVSYVIITRYKRKSGEQTPAADSPASSATQSRRVPWPHGPVAPSARLVCSLCP